MAHGNLCHECPHSAQIQRGDYALTPWEKTPCAACMAGNGDRAVESLEQGHGRILPSNDALDTFMHTVANGDPGAQPELGLQDAMELLRAFCMGLVGASGLQRRILALRLEGLTPTQIAAQLHRSKQSIAGSWKRLERRCFAKVALT